MRSYSVSEAAERLGLSPQRVRALIAQGALPADRVGGRFVLDVEAVRSFRVRERPGGRPLAARNAWAVLAELSGRPGVAASSERSRHRVRRLVESGGPKLIRALRAAEPRAREERWRVLPGDLARIGKRRDVILGGLSADNPRFNIRHDLERDGLEAYVDARLLGELDRQYKPEKGSSRPNLVLRIPRGDAWILEEEKAPLPVVAADLLNHDDPRVRRSAEAGLQASIPA